jgi:hypothetical protein
MDRLDELKINKIIQEYTFLKTDESLKREIIQEGTPVFLGIVNSRLVNIDSGMLKEQDKTGHTEPKKILPKIDVDSIDNNTKVKLKKIFREIVKHTHPDKTDNHDMNLLYMDAKIHYDSYDLFELYFIARSLSINMKLTLDETRTLNDLIEFKRNEIATLEQSYIWLWINSENAVDKENVVQSFIKTHYLI